MTVNNVVSASNSQLIAAVSVAEEDPTEQYPAEAVVGSSALHA